MFSTWVRFLCFFDLWMIVLDYFAFMYQPWRLVFWPLCYENKIGKMCVNINQTQPHALKKLCSYNINNVRLRRSKVKGKPGAPPSFKWIIELGNFINISSNVLNTWININLFPKGRDCLVPPSCSVN